jgi:hypothetical protein
MQVKTTVKLLTIAFGLCVALLSSCPNASAMQAWSALGTAGFSAGQADYVSFAFKSDGTPYVAYSDG